MHQNTFSVQHNDHNVTCFKTKNESYDNLIRSPQNVVEMTASVGGNRWQWRRNIPLLAYLHVASLKSRRAACEDFLHQQRVFYSP